MDQPQHIVVPSPMWKLTANKTTNYVFMRKGKTRESRGLTINLSINNSILKRPISQSQILIFQI